MALPLGGVPACTRDRVTSDDASSSVSDPQAESASSSAMPAPGAPVVGNSCSPGRDSITCAPDGLEVLTCASGQWRMLQPCRGPGRCVGTGSALVCDTGIPQPGDSCVQATAEPRCRNAHEAIACQGGKWMVSPCAQGCGPGAGKDHAGCK